MEPSIIPGGIAVDDRDTTRFANGFDLFDVTKISPHEWM
jgi:hypothetical protein